MGKPSDDHTVRRGVLLPCHEGRAPPGDFPDILSQIAGGQPDAFGFARRNVVRCAAGARGQFESCGGGRQGRRKDQSDSFHHKSFSPNWICRVYVLVLVITPKLGLPKVVFGSEYSGRFNALKPDSQLAPGG